MKTIGLIGGMSWESSAEYYRIINEEVKRQLGGLHSAKCILFSVDFAEIEALQAAGEWEKAGDILAATGKSLQLAGADFIVLCTNTMHLVIDQIIKEVEIPVLHIADATAGKIIEEGFNSIALLGTKYTMEKPFLKANLIEKGINVIIPNEEERTEVNRVIFEELCLGQLNTSSKNRFLSIIDRLKEEGADGVILGCTEIPLLIKPEDVSIPLFDTTSLHSLAAVRMALRGED